jgi:hypothetical protein
MTPTQRSTQHLRGLGYLVEKVEQRVPHTNTTRDLFGIVDLLAIRPGEVLGVQVTSGSNVAARVRKIADHPNTPAVREAGIGIVVQGWRKNAAGKWTMREVVCS